jgi:hypothetical protein
VITVAAGGYHSLSLRADGRTVAWGDNSFGQTGVPGSLSNVLALAGGTFHSVALADNLPPSAFSRSFTGFPNHDLTIQFRGADPNGDRLNFRVVSLPDVGSLYQFDGDNRGAPILIGQLLTDTGGRAIFTPETNSIGGPYASFTYVANDGESESPPATAVQYIILPPSPQLSGSGLTWNSSSGAEINFTGDPGATYRIWASSNLIDWVSLGTASSISNSWFQFFDSGATNGLQRFYRAGAP